MKDIQPQIRKCKIDGTSIDYLHYEGGEKTIIFLHATGFLPWLWHPIARELLSEFTVLAPYFCNHRFAEPEEGGVHWEMLAKDLFNFCRNLGLENPYLVGHSMGATVMTLAHAFHHSPASGMILIEPIFLPESIYNLDMTVEQHPLASKSIKRKNFWENRFEAISYLKSKKLFSAWDREMLELYVEYGMVTGESGGLELTCHPRREAALFMGSIHLNPWPILEKITCPVLVVEGGGSENRAFIDLKKAASMIPQGSYHEVKGAGHLVPMESPMETVNIIRDFFCK